MPKQKPRLFEMPTGHSGMGWHQIEPFTVCPKEYQLSRVRGISPTQPFLPEPLSRGLLVHAARAQWLHDDRKGDTWREAMKLYKTKVEKEEEVKLAPGSLDAALSDFEGYAAYWKLRPVTKVLAIEYPLKLRGLLPGAPAWAHRTARLDSIEQHQGRVWIGELKSTSSGVGRLTDHYTLHGQLLLQMALWGPEEVVRFGPLAGVLLDPLLKGSSSKKASGAARIAVPIERVQHALGWFRRDLQTWVMQTSLIDWNARVERRPVCMRPYGPCKFRDLCLRGRASGNGYVLEDGTPMHMWQPSPGKEVPPWD